MSLPNENEASERFEMPLGLTTRSGSSTPTPFGEERDAAQRLFSVVWNLIRAVCLAAALVVMVPQVLTPLGASDAYRWMRAHAWVHWVSVPLLFALILISALEPRKSRRAGGDDDPALGPAPDPPAGFDLRDGFPVGDARQWAIEGFSFRAGSWRSQKHRRFVASAALASNSRFAFSARHPASEPAWMRGLAQQAIRMSVEQVKKSHPEIAANVDAMDFLSRDPLPLAGHPLAGELLLRSNEPERGSALFADGDVVRGIRSLAAARVYWTLTLLPEGASGELHLRFECPERGDTEARDATTRALLSAVLRRLELPPAAARESPRSRGVA